MNRKKIRSPAVAGRFYPADAHRLREMVAGFLAAAKASNIQPKALIAPHAGYVYSGPVAGSAYASLQKTADAIRRVVLLGPAHTMPLRGLAASSHHAWATPLGVIPVDRTAQEKALALPQVSVLDEAHAYEHGLEVHLPFLQLILSDFQIAPLVVGEADTAEVAELLQILWGGPETLVVISSDLSHYYDYHTARQLDEATSRAIESLQPEALGRESACGRYPIRGLLAVARQRGLRAYTIDLRNSGDTAGSRDQVVGYGAYLFS